MAFAGLKKQINKANQYVTEKMGGAEGTKLDMDFMEMERKTDVTVELVEELQLKTKEYLQPNPTARAKMAAVKGISKLSGQAKSNTYPQPEGILAECMLTYGKKLGEDSIFAQALIEFGESLKQMADVKYSLDDNIKQNVLEPLHHLQTKDLKEVMHHRKKLQGRRLDFDCKRRRQAKVRSPMGSPIRTSNVIGSHITDDEIRSAEDKFGESMQLAQMGMYNLLENDVEQVSQLVTFSEAMYEFHSQCADILKVLQETLQEKREEAESRPKIEFIPKPLHELNLDSGEYLGEPGTNGGVNRHGFMGLGNGGGIGGSSDGSYSSIRSRSQANAPNRFNKSYNSHHQLYSSQQNLSTNSLSLFKSNNNNNNNNNNNSEYKNSNFNRMYGSHQSLKISNNKKNSKKSDMPSVDLDASFDWLNAWNNPPPSNPPTASNFSSSTSDSQSNNYNNNNNKSNQINSHLQFNSNNNAASRSIASYNDPWTVTKPTHLELDNGHTQARSTNASPLPSPMRSPAKTPATNKQPCCQALYDFDPENPGELGFKENDIIQLLNRVDENWYEGSVNGRTGYFPQSYVQIVVPLPN